ncbi:sensor histidine kinase [Belliella pelovolcani]|uniref:histidine kinase n=1 Tax=Belliella pelovolcani TaxID=529505 RepID=A0A1N7PS35_9BACT|nr:sensor histidine kinase [Belliella pelovolcani]SIT13408.1 Signal transduction histidine kinase [Belliella pelovolcani]
MDNATKILELKKRLSDETQKVQPDSALIASINEEIEELEITQIPFTVSARTARLIGQENFANAEGAIIELVKNSYDADASVCIIIIDPVNDSIRILDNGDGMTEKIIRNQWMTIGTDDKKVNFKTKSRIKTGAKGIGRFALDRLGKSSVMITKTLDSESLVWDVDWNQFDNSGAVISDIKATLQIGNSDFWGEIIEMQNFTGLKEPIIDHWKEEKGTLISIDNLKDTWDERATQSLYSNLEILVPPLETNIFQLFLYSTLEPDKYGKVLPTLCDDYDYKVTATVNDSQSVSIKVSRNELNFGDLRRIGFFEKSKLNEPQYQFSAFEKGEFEITTKLETLIAGYKGIDKNNNLSKIGAFTFSFYFMKRGGGQEKDEEVGKYPYKAVNYSNRTSWLDKFGGIKIFRDNFRVRPYGETKSSSFDWLDLGKRALSNPTVTRPGYRVRPQQVYGIVNISRIDNINFEDKSSREGLQENDTFTLFKEILKSVIEIFEQDRNQIMMTLKKIYDENNKKAKAKEEADRIIKNKKDKKSDSDSSDPSADKDTLINAIEAYKEDIEELQDEQKILRVLASAGLIVTSFAHEFKNHADSILPRTYELLEVLNQVVDEAKVSQLPDFFNPYKMLEDMKNQDIRLKAWLDFSILSVRKDKRTSKVINLVAYVESLKRIWTPLLSRRNIKLIVDKGNFLDVRFKGHEIDLDGIFHNLIVNSVDAFKREDSSPDRQIKIRFSINFNEKLGISTVYEDTGPGLLDEIIEPNKIFQPFFTTKRDDKTGEKTGTGLGMWIIKSNVDGYNGEVEILEARPNFKIKILLPHY